MKRDYILNDSTRLSFGYEMFYIQTLCDSCMMDFKGIILWMTLLNYPLVM